MSCRMDLMVLVLGLILTEGCLGLVTQRNFKWEKPKLLKQACNITTTSGKVLTKQCGCEGEDPVSCNLGPLALPQYRVTAAMFCDVSVDKTNERSYGALLKSACLIKSADEASAEIFKQEPCDETKNDEDITCNIGPLPVFIGDTDSRAYFCNTGQMEDYALSGKGRCIRLGRSRGKNNKRKIGDRKITKLLGKACNITTTDGKVTTRQCGCDGEDPVPCNMGPIALPRYGIASATYCNAQVHTKKGKFIGMWRSACLIRNANSSDVIKDDPCKQWRGDGDVICDLGPLSVVVDGTDALVYFCNRSTDVNIQELDDNPTCVNLEKYKGGKKDTDGKKEKEGRKDRKDKKGKEDRKDRGDKKDKKGRKDRGDKKGKEGRKDRGDKENKKGRKDRGDKKGKEDRKDRGGEIGKEGRKDRGGKNGTEGRKDRG